MTILLLGFDPNYTLSLERALGSGTRFVADTSTEGNRLFKDPIDVDLLIVNGDDIGDDGAIRRFEDFRSRYNCRAIVAAYAPKAQVQAEFSTRIDTHKPILTIDQPEDGCAFLKMPLLLQTLHEHIRHLRANLAHRSGKKENWNMTTTILILTENIAFATSLQRALTGAPLSACGHVISAATSEAVESIASEVAVDLVLVDASCFDDLMQLLEAGELPTDVRYLRFSWETSDSSPFTLHYPVRLTALAQAIDTAFQTPAAQWQMQKRRSLRFRHAQAFASELRELRHQYRNAAGPRQLLLDRLLSIQNETQQAQMLSQVVVGTEGKPRWTEKYANGFATLCQRYRELLEEKATCEMCEELRSALEALSRFTDPPPSPLTHEQLQQQASQFQTVMRRVDVAFEALKATLETNLAPEGRDVLR